MNQKQKEFTKIFIFLYILAFILFNWNDVSWLFNYRAITGLADDFFNPYQDSTLLVAADSHLDNLVHSNEVVTPATEKKPEFPYTDKANSVEIPAIGLETPLVIGQATDNDSLMTDLDKGVVYYPGSVYPGENGEIVILGHSAPPNWPHIKHDWVFSHLTDLTMGDQITVYFNNHKYTYTVISKDIVQKGEELRTGQLSRDHNILTLVSCWPPGKNYKRIAVQAQLVIE